MGKSVTPSALAGFTRTYSGTAFGEGTGLSLTRSAGSHVQPFPAFDLVFSFTRIQDGNKTFLQVMRKRSFITETYGIPDSATLFVAFWKALQHRTRILGKKSVAMHIPIFALPQDVRDGFRTILAEWA